MYTFLTILHVFLCVFLIVVVLLQAGKGGGMGIAFGGGGSQTVFGSSGAGNFLTRATAIIAIGFFLNSLALAYLSSQSDSKRLQTLSEKKKVEKETQKKANDDLAKDIEKSRPTPPVPGAPSTTPPITIEQTKAPTAPEAAKPADKAAPEKAAPEKAAAPEGAEAPKPKRQPKAAAPKETAPEEGQAEKAPATAPAPAAPTAPATP
jgi:preprotein translocase subunit SecG